MTTSGFIYLVAVSFLLGICSAAQGGALSMAFKDFVSSGITVETIHTLLLNVGGFYIGIGSLPVYLVWVKYLSLFFYGYVLLVSYVWQSVGAITCLPSESACFKDGADVLAAFGMSKFDDASAIYFGGFFSLTAALYFIGYLLLRKRLREYAD